ncbi:MAG: Phosphate acetyltransferase [Chlamydiae bacterium]|nr:Phosphate acetyltransferase [Chlamydiota bacterium]
MTKNAIFIAATGQNVGKTTTCLGLISGLRKRYSKVGFIKPVGQQHVTINKNLKVDKDVVLFHEVFHLDSPYEDMSPVIVHPGFTKEFLDGDHGSLCDKIVKSFERIYSQNDYTIVEGTGHVGVGSIIDQNNAKVASELGLDVVIILPGGLGSAFDELALNIEMCLSKNINIRGVILNRVLQDKRDMILNYFPKALARWNIPLIGCIPYNEFLNTPTMKDFALLFETDFLSSDEHSLRHFRDKRLVACSLEAYYAEIVPNELIITPASRKDIILATLEQHKKMDLQGGMILTGRHAPDADIMKKIKHSDVPILYAPMCTYEAMKKITSFTAKIRKEDESKVNKAIELVEHNVDFNLLCQTQYAQN